MDDPQDLLEAFNGRWGVLAWGAPGPVKHMLRTILRQCPAQQGPAPADPCVVESMMYGCRVAEVATILFTSDTMQQVCEALAGRRDFVAEQLSAYLEAQTGRRTQQAPRPTPLPQGPPPPLARPPLPAEPWRPLEPQGPAPSRRARLSPGPGAERAPSAAAPPPGGAAAAGDLLPPLAGAAALAPPPRSPFQVAARRASRPAARGLERGGAAALPPAAPRWHGGTRDGEGQGCDRPLEPLLRLPGAGDRPGECREDPRAFAPNARSGAAGGRGQPPPGWPQHPQAQGQGVAHGQGRPLQDPTRTMS